jgi:hypothetical protein
MDRDCGPTSGIGFLPNLPPLRAHSRTSVPNGPFIKQWGGVQKKRAGRELDGRTWDEIPRSKPARERQVKILF